MACARIAWCSWIGNLLNGHDISFRKVLDCCCCIVVILALLSLFFPLPLFPYRGPGLELSENILLLTEFMLMLWFISTTFTTKAAFTGDDSTLSFLGFLFWLEESDNRCLQYGYTRITTIRMTIYSSTCREWDHWLNTSWYFLHQVQVISDQ